MRSFSIDYSEPETGPSGIVEVKIAGFMDTHTIDVFEKKMDELLQRNYKQIIIDLSQLKYISSAGIGALMLLLQQLHRRQGDLVILQPSPKVHKIMNLLGFTRLFNIAQDHDGAVQMLS